MQRNPATGKLQSIVINPNVKTELVEDIVDKLLYEQHKDEPTITWEELRKKLAKKHNLDQWPIK